MSNELIVVDSIIGIHIFAGIGALFIGIALIFLIPIKTNEYAKVGWLWLGLLGILVATSFQIKVLDPGNFSPVHGLSLILMALMAIQFWAARNKKIRFQRYSVIGSFVLLLVVLAALVSTPGGVLNQWFS